MKDTDPAALTDDQLADQIRTVDAELGRIESRRRALVREAMGARKWTSYKVRQLTGLGDSTARSVYATAMRLED